MGYSSRIMAESWESNTLYWAALADELSLPPAELNVRIPEWTRKLVEQIFASHLEDWPAVLRSLRAVGDDVRSAHASPAQLEQKAAPAGVCLTGKTIMTISRRGLSWNDRCRRLCSARRIADSGPIFRVKVDMVVLSFQVTDSKNHYINGLKPTDFRIFEDGILQKISTFAEGAKAPAGGGRGRRHAPAAGGQ